MSRPVVVVRGPRFTTFVAPRCTHAQASVPLPPVVALRVKLESAVSRSRPAGATLFSMPTHTLTIQDLYNRVWAAPIDGLAEEFGLSGRGLAKLCARHKIPVPGRGFWARKEWGYEPKATPLPASVNPDRQIAITSSHPDQPPAEEPQDDQPRPEFHPLVAFERDPANRIVVPERVRLTHPLIRQTQAFWNRPADAPWDAVLWPLDLRVSKPERKRALRIMQALLAALDERGMAIEIKDRKTIVNVLGYQQQIHMTERQKQVPHVLSAYEQANKAKGYWVPKKDRVYTGLLTLEIERAFWTRNKWIDGERRKVEDCLNEVVEGLVQASLTDAKHAEERRQREMEWAEQERRRHEEQERIKQLNDWMARWRQSRELRQFLAEAREAREPIEEGSEAEQWFEWAQGYAKAIDPFPKAR
jgi:hypothetical protein